ncbi:MAG: hemolysin family protein [Phycisphaerales bacterium]
MDPSDTPFIIVLAVLLVGSAFASGSETALFGVTHGQRATLRRTNPTLGRMVDALLSRPRELLMQVLLLNMVINVSYFIVTSVLTLRAEGGVAQVLISVVSLATIILMGEVFAKLFASGATLLFLRIAAPAHLLIRRPIAGLLRVLDVWVISPLARLVAPSSGAEQDSEVTPEQLAKLISMSAGEGVLERSEQLVLTSIVEMGHLRVEQVMTPRVDMEWVSPDATLDELAAFCRRTGRSRTLVCERGLDDGMLGIMDARRVFEGTPIREAIRPVLYVPEQTRLDMLMEQLRKSGRRVGVCVDEHGGVSGVITIADILKELLEELEHPDEHPSESIEDLGNGRWSVPGRLSIRDWSVLFKDRSLIEHSKHVNTLGGLVMVLLDRLPEVGDRVNAGSIEMRVVSMEERAIDRIELRVGAADQPAAGEVER